MRRSRAYCSRSLIEGTVDHHASTAFPGLQEVTIHWRGSYGYLTAWAGDYAGNPTAAFDTAAITHLAEYQQ